MLVIGLTGPSGAGKGLVAELFASYGLPVLNADEIYHRIMIPPSACLDEMVAYFGTQILTPEHTLDRKVLSGIVFSSSEALANLNRIAHKHVMEEVRRALSELRKKDVPAAVFDAPQLFEAHAERDCNIVISVLADPTIRLERIMRRDGIDRTAAQKRINAQLSDSFFRSHSDYVIENNDTPELLRPFVHKVLSEMGVLQS